MGKREMGQLSTTDIVVSILIAEMCAISIENYNESILFSIIPIIILLFFELLSSFLSLKFNRVRYIIDGKPSLIINKGKINYREMLKQRYTLDDLMMELRNNNIDNLKDVEYAVLENNGKLNIFKYKSFINKSHIPFPLILDGVIQNDTLVYINKNEDWLYDYLNDNNLNIDDIFYGFYKNNRIYVILKNETLR
jgi:uncharacterized membrane protein YcaP (DUF421 family)